MRKLTYGTKVTCLVLLAVMAVLGFSECNRQINTPPDIKEAEQRFRENQKQIQIVVDYMIESEYEDIYIDDDDGSMLVDLEDIPIADKQVISAIKHLLGKKQYRTISKNGNTIAFFQWTGLQDITCGIAYAINSEEQLYIEFATHIEPMTEPGWYYYVEDYNQWRDVYE